VLGGFAGYHLERSIVLNVHQQGAEDEVNCNGAALAVAAEKRRWSGLRRDGCRTKRPGTLNYTSAVVNSTVIDRDPGGNDQKGFG
jgi:hypothetical protein